MGLIELVLIGLVCLLPVAAVIALGVVLWSRSKRPTPETGEGQATTEAREDYLAPTGWQPYESASSDVPAAPPLPEVHAPSDDIEQTTRLTRDGSRPAQAPGEGSAAPEEHTYWDDEDEEQQRQADALLDQGAADTEIDTGANEQTVRRTELPPPSPATDIRDGGYGWGSAEPVPDGSVPHGHPVKANHEWMQYHEPGSPWYDQAPVDVWFVDAATAERCGFHRA
ncbi:hypothetical protein [Marihabitans asiaticum]|uniref:sunset domain-containing protein n=1 Tax=Marihabitans asiaticum TaxID=415218 RepID=UPI0011A50AC0|nr:hypothetical protein [Marihabitans asiaticum]